MSMVAFEYRDFWEVPRLIVCTVGGIEILLDSEFDEAANRYASHYKVFAMPPELDPESPDAAEELLTVEAEYLGSIPVGAIEFDPTKRIEMDVGPLLELLKRREKRLHGDVD
jgi:hypothetical protein